MGHAPGSTGAAEVPPLVERIEAQVERFAPGFRDRDPRSPHDGPGRARTARPQPRRRRRRRRQLPTAPGRVPARPATVALPHAAARASTSGAPPPSPAAPSTACPATPPRGRRSRTHGPYALLGRRPHAGTPIRARPAVRGNPEARIRTNFGDEVAYMPPPAPKFGSVAGDDVVPLNPEPPPATRTPAGNPRPRRQPAPPPATQHPAGERTPIERPRRGGVVP